MDIAGPPTKVATTAVTGAIFVVLLLMGGCGVATAPGTRLTPGATTTVPTSPSGGPTSTGTEPTETPPAGAVQLSERSGGHTVVIHRGDRVVLTLDNTYWRIAPPDGRILTQIGTQTVQPAAAGTCLPGMGCGAVRAVFSAAASGSTDVGASRTSCGEAMGCPPGQGSYVVHLIVR